MDRKRITLAALIVIIILVSAVFGITIHYNGILNEENTKIAQLENQLMTLNNEASNLTKELTNLTAPCLVATLTTQEIWEHSQEYPGGPNYTIPFNFVQITGTVTNTGESKAFNVGLHVVGHDLNGNLVANVTIPLSGGYFGVDNATDAYGNGSLTLGSLDGGQIAKISDNVIHEGMAYNWTAVPVWTNSS